MNKIQKQFTTPGRYSIKISNIKNVMQPNVDYKYIKDEKNSEVMSNSTLIYRKYADAQKNVISIYSFLKYSNDATVSIDGKNIDIDQDGSIILENTNDIDKNEYEVHFDKLRNLQVNNYFGRQGEKVTKYRYYVQGNLNLIKAYINIDLLKSLGDYSFFCCKKLDELQFFYTKLTSRLFKIGKYCFANCTSIAKSMPYPLLQFPVGLTEVDDYAFYNCDRIVAMKFPKTIKSIGKGALAKCKNLKYVIFDNLTAKQIKDMPGYGTWFDTNDRVLIIPGISKGENNGFKNFYEKYVFKYYAEAANQMA